MHDLKLLKQPAEEHIHLNIKHPYDLKRKLIISSPCKLIAVPKGKLFYSSKILIIPSRGKT